jgi:ABC-type phosphate/phosphonate transport system permease subunit
MDANILIQLATLISVIAAVIGLMISVRAYKRQVSALFLLEYTKRVDDIMRSFPPSLWAPRLFPRTSRTER